MRYKDEKKRIAINEHTMNIVFEHGLEGLTMASLAKLVDISKSTLYIYHKSKDDLINNLYSELMTVQSGITLNKVDDNENIKTKLKAVWLYWLKYSVENQKEMHFLKSVTQGSYYDKLSQETKNLKAQMRNTIFDEGKDVLKPVSNEVLSSISSAMLHHSAMLIHNGHFTTSEQDTNVLFSFFWDAIKS